MLTNQTGLNINNGMTRRRMITLGLLGVSGWMLTPIRMAGAALQEDLEQVSIIPNMAQRDGPLLVFRDFVSDPDVEVKQHIRLQLGQRKEILAQLKTKIEFEKQVNQFTLFE